VHPLKELRALPQTRQLDYRGVMPPKGAGVIRDKNGTKEAEEKKNREKGRY